MAEEHPESTPEQLQQRIEAYQRRHNPQPGFGRAVALVMSLGVTFAAVMYGAFVLGGMLEQHTGSRWCLPVTLLLGAVAGSWIGYLLIRPLLREDA